MSKEWMSINSELMKRDGMKVLEKSMICNALVEAFWRYVISIWVQRNEMEHETKYSMPLLEKDKVTQQMFKACVKYWENVKWNGCLGKTWKKIGR